MTQFNTPTYDIARPTGQCAFTGKTLEPGEEYMATLVEIVPSDDDDAANADDAQASQNDTAAAFGLRRVDVSLEAWQEGRRPDSLFSHWRATIPTPNEKKKLFVDDDVLLNLLRRLADTDDADRLAFRFVLALILMRKKMLRYDRSEKHEATNDAGEQATVEQELWHMTPKLDPSKGPLGKWNDDETITVLNPQLDETRIAQVTDQLNEILNAEL